MRDTTVWKRSLVTDQVWAAERALRALIETLEQRIEALEGADGWRCQECVRSGETTIR